MNKLNIKRIFSKQIKIIIAIILLSFVCAQNKVHQSDKNIGANQQDHQVAESKINKDIYLVLTNDGKLYSYNIKKKLLNWMSDLKVVISELKFSSDRMQQENSNNESRDQSTDIQVSNEQNFDKYDYFLPSSDGNFIFLSSDSQPIKITREEIEQVIKICPISGNDSKYVAFTKEKIYLINPDNGELQKLENIEDDIDKYLNHYIINVNQKLIKQLNIYTKKENWSLISTDVNLMIYEDFLFEGIDKNKLVENDQYIFMQDQHQDLKIKDKQSKVKIVDFQTDQEIISIFSFSGYGKSFQKNIIVHDPSMNTFNPPDFVRN